MKNLWSICLIISLGLFAVISGYAEIFQSVNYTIIEQTNLGSVKGSIDVRLEKKVTKNFLQKFALELRAIQRRKYDRLFIMYYLPA